MCCSHGAHTCRPVLAAWLSWGPCFYWQAHLPYCSSSGVSFADPRPFSAQFLPIAWCASRWPLWHEHAQLPVDGGPEQPSDCKLLFWNRSFPLHSFFVEDCGSLLWVSIPGPSISFWSAHHRYSEMHFWANGECLRFLRGLCFCALWYSFNCSSFSHSSDAFAPLLGMPGHACVDSSPRCPFVFFNRLNLQIQSVFTQFRFVSEDVAPRYAACVAYFLTFRPKREFLQRSVMCLEILPELIGEGRILLTSICFYFIYSFSWNLPELSTPVILLAWGDFRLPSWMLPKPKKWLVSYF